MKKKERPGNGAWIAGVSVICMTILTIAACRRAPEGVLMTTALFALGAGGFWLIAELQPRDGRRRKELSICAALLTIAAAFGLVVQFTVSAAGGDRVSAGGPSAMHRPSACPVPGTPAHQHPFAPSPLPGLLR